MKDKNRPEEEAPLQGGEAPETEDEEEEKDELEELLFFRHLEENGGKVGGRAYLMGCASVLPFLAFIVIAIFFLLRHFYGA